MEAVMLKNEEIIDKLITAKSDRAEKKAAQLESLIKKQEEPIEQVMDTEMADEDNADWEDIADDETIDDGNH